MERKRRDPPGAPARDLSPFERCLTSRAGGPFVVTREVPNRRETRRDGTRRLESHSKSSSFISLLFAPGARPRLSSRCCTAQQRSAYVKQCVRFRSAGSHSKRADH